MKAALRSAARLENIVSFLRASTATCDPQNRLDMGRKGIGRPERENHGIACRRKIKPLPTMERTSKPKHKGRFAEVEDVRNARRTGPCLRGKELFTAGIAKRARRGTPPAAYGRKSVHGTITPIRQRGQPSGTVLSTPSSSVSLWF